MNVNKDDPYEYEPIKYRCKLRKTTYEDFVEEDDRMVSKQRLEKIGITKITDSPSTAVHNSLSQRTRTTIKSWQQNMPKRASLLQRLRQLLSTSQLQRSTLHL
jgi:hypothetical protein